MSAENNIYANGIPKSYRVNGGVPGLGNTVEICIVKDNIDPTHTGRIRVYSNTFGGEDENNSRYWKTVSYLSPWFGFATHKYDLAAGVDNTGYGTYPGTPHSYGFWATAPDLGTKVICVFIADSNTDGYYIGCVPEPGLTHMVPAIGASSNVQLNKEEAATYGGADRLPVAEINYANPALRDSKSPYNEPKPVHSYQASILHKQGIIRDNLRGVIGSSSQRETPSRVFGMSTPGYPIYSGGFTKKNILQAAASAPNEKLQIEGRTGGHSFVMDDGTLDGQDQLLRLRTGDGHMIMMSDSGHFITIMHSNGQTYIELGKEGTVDIFSTNSVNIRTQGDLNLHADRDVNINAKRNLNLLGKNVQVEAEADLKNYAGKTFSNTAMAAYSLNATGAMTFSSTGPAGFASTTGTWINGGAVFLNTGKSPVPATPVSKLTRTNHSDTVWNQSKGWINPGPEKLQSVVSRAPAHMPWPDLGKGVDVKTGKVQGPLTPPTPPGVIAAAAAATSGPGPQLATTSALTTTVPDASGGPSNEYTYPDALANAMVSQNAANAALVPQDQKISAGIVPGVAGATLAQVSGPGLLIKPGAGNFVAKLGSLAPGLPFEKIASPVLMTGNGGISTPQELLNNVGAQVSAVKTAFSDVSIKLGQSGALGGASQILSAGPVFAAATINDGLEKVSSALKDPVRFTVQAASGTKFGAALASGIFAANMADQLMSGQNGLAKSLNSLVAGASGAAGKIGSLFGLNGTSSNAYSVVYNSYVNLPSGRPIKLGGGGSQDITTDPTTLATTNYQRAEDSYTFAQKEVVTAEGVYRSDPTQENLTALRQAQSREAAAKSKFESLRNAAAGKETPLSAQGASTLVNTALSGQNLIPTTKNSGINALPGGLAAMAGVVVGTANGAMATVKKLIDFKLPSANGLVDQAGAKITQGITALTNPIKNTVLNATQQFQDGVNKIIAVPGNLMASVKSITQSTDKLLGGAPAQLQAFGNQLTGNINNIAGQFTAGLNNIGGQLTAGLNNITGQFTSAINGFTAPLQQAASKFIGSVAGPITGAFAGLSSVLGSFGKAKIQERRLAENTFAPAGPVNAKVATLTNSADNPLGQIVPQPLTEVVPFKEVQTGLTAAAGLANQTISAATDLANVARAQQEQLKVLGDRLVVATSKFTQSQNPGNLDQIRVYSNEVSQAQKNFQQTAQKYESGGTG